MPRRGRSQWERACWRDSAERAPLQLAPTAGQKEAYSLIVVFCVDTSNCLSNIPWGDMNGVRSKQTPLEGTAELISAKNLEDCLNTRLSRHVKQMGLC
jgi:hypothetical protein